MDNLICIISNLEMRLTMLVAELEVVRHATCDKDVTSSKHVKPSPLY